MKDYRVLIIVAIVLACVVLLVPTFTNFEAPWYPAEKINLGLDLQGGMHIVLQVDVEKALRDELGLIATKSLPATFAERKLAYQKAYVGDKADRFYIEFATDAERDAAFAYLNSEWKRFKVTTETIDGKPAVALAFHDEELQFIRDNALKQARETINNRVDEFQVREPEIYTHGGDQIIVRLPGVVDPARAKGLIGKTAALEIKLITDKAKGGASKEALLAEFGNQLPEGYAIYEAKGVREGEGAYLLRTTPDFAGSYLTDARVGYDQYQAPSVDFQFNDEGAEKFAALTAANLNQRLAIVLDNVVYSAPVIRARISDRGQITGDFTREEALDLSIVLRAGALPVPVRIDEERTVGATLGEDSIRSGLISFLIGGLVVVLFMAVYYRAMGIGANVALILNVAMLMAGMAMFGATLTMPGIAGIILTVGMAVDANVLINERIREELRAGKTTNAAVRIGYQRATVTILDANITTLVAAAVLYQFGTGPIKGFAVTLTIGLIASVFTSIVVTRIIADALARRSRDYLSI
jgi:preprotein translocase subunit SecD